MATQFKYTSRDFDSLMQEMVSKVPELAPLWTNLNPGDLGMALIAMMAGTGDMLSFGLDRAAEEVFLPTAKSRAAVQRLISLIDYRMSRPVAARTLLRFSVDSTDHPGGAPANITIPALTVCKNREGLYFVTRQDAALYSGQFHVEVEAFQGELRNQSFVATGEDVQRYRLAEPNVAENFLIVTVGTEEWTEDRTGTSLTLKKLYDVSTDAREFATVSFSRFLGDVPAQDVPIEVTYLETRGEVGNIGSGIIRTLVSTFAYSDILSVDNVLPAEGGQQRESLEYARVAAPRHLRFRGTVVTIQDFMDALDSFPKVAKSQAIDHHGYAELYLALNNQERLYVECPAFTAATVPGGSFTTGHHTVLVTAVDARGETGNFRFRAADREVIPMTLTVAVPAGSAVRVTVTNPAGATGFHAYVNGQRTTTAPVQAHTSGTTTFTIPGPVASGIAEPERNTTGARAQDGSEPLTWAVEKYLDERRLIGCVFALFNPTYRPVDIAATLRIFDNFRQADVRGAVQTALRDFFDFQRSSFQKDVLLSELYYTIMSVPGVRNVAFLAPEGDIHVGAGEITTLGATTLTMQGGVL
jgi:hypothetical protein